MEENALYAPGGDGPEQDEELKDQSEKKDGAGRRWWEFYVIRYAVGTVIGATALYTLFRASPPLQPLLFEDGGKTSIDKIRLTLLGAYGFVYCYIASAPILVFHAGRFLLGLRKTTITKSLAAILVISLLSEILIHCLLWTDKVSDQPVVWWLSFCFFCFIWWVQVWIVALSLNHSHELYSFYETLATRRTSVTNGITDSYRALREHGNAFFIIFLEIMLAMELFATGSLATSDRSTDPGKNAWVAYLTVLMLWIFPSALVWFIGTIFERRFSEGNDKSEIAATALSPPKRSRHSVGMWLHSLALVLEALGTLLIFLEARRILAQLRAVDASYAGGPPPGYVGWIYDSGVMGVCFLLAGILISGIVLWVDHRGRGS